MSLVGFRITNYNGHEKEAVEFLRTICIFEDPQIAQNIVNCGPNMVNVFSQSVTAEMLDANGFSWTPIEVSNGRALLVSLVNFRLEVSYNGTLYVLMPADYIEMPEGHVQAFSKFLEQQYLGAIIGKESVVEYINLKPSTVYFSSKGGANPIWVDSNAPWNLV